MFPSDEPDPGGPAAVSGTQAPFSSERLLDVLS